MENIQPLPVGTLEKEPRYVLRVHVGEASMVSDGKKYNFDMSVAPNNSPIITCKETGYQFSLGWDEILTLAIQVGITTKEEKQS